MKLETFRGGLLRGNACYDTSETTNGFFFFFFFFFFAGFTFESHIQGIESVCQPPYIGPPRDSAFSTLHISLQRRRLI